MAGHKLAIGIAHTYDELALTLGIDRAYVFFALNDILRALEDTCLAFGGSNQLRIAHVDGIVLHQSVLSTIAKGGPLLGNGGYLHIARGALEQHLAIGSGKLDVAIGGLGIVNPEGNKVSIGYL